MQQEMMQNQEEMVWNMARHQERKRRNMGRKSDTLILGVEQARNGKILARRMASNSWTGWWAEIGGSDATGNDAESGGNGVEHGKAPGEKEAQHGKEKEVEDRDSLALISHEGAAMLQLD